MFYNDVLYLHLSFTGTIHLNIIFILFVLFQLRYCQSGPECPLGEFPLIYWACFKKNVFIFFLIHRITYMCVKLLCD